MAVRLLVGLLALVALPLWAIVNPNVGFAVAPPLMPISLVVELVVFGAYLYYLNPDIGVPRLTMLAGGFAIVRLAVCAFSALTVVAFFHPGRGPIQDVFYQMWQGHFVTMALQVLVLMQTGRDFLAGFAPGVVPPLSGGDLFGPPAGATAKRPEPGPPSVPLARVYRDFNRYIESLPGLVGFGIYTADGFLVWAHGPEDEQWEASRRLLPRLIAMMDRAGGRLGDAEVEEWEVEANGVVILGSRVYPRFRLVAMASPNSEPRDRHLSYKAFRQSVAGFLRRRYQDTTTLRGRRLR